MIVTFCFLTRNHGDCLGRALRSVPTELGPTLVADTGSTDGTLSVAASEASQVLQLTWKQDFSLACNQTLEAVTTPWVLWLNPDEELAPNVAEVLRQATQDPALFAARLPVQQLPRANQPNRFTVGQELRLFRNEKAVRYTSRLHPRFEPPLEALAHERGMLVGQVPALITRHAYRNTLTPDKIKWVTSLLEAELADNPHQLGLKIELGRNLLRLNDPRGHEVLRECAQQVLLVQDAPRSPDPMVGQLLEYVLNVSPELNQTGLGKIQAGALGLKWFPMTPPVLWAIAAERFAAQDFASAIEPLSRLVQCGLSQNYDSAGGFDPDIIGAVPMLNLGICLIQLGDLANAKTCLMQIVQDPQLGERAARLIAHCEALTKEPKP